MSLLKIAIALVIAAAAVYIADVGRPEAELPQGGSTTSPATANATEQSNVNVTEVALSTLQTFVKSLTQGAGVQFLNVELRSDLNRPPRYASMHAVAKNDAADGDVALIIPAALQFNDNTADASLRKGLGFFIENDPDIAAKLRAKSNRDFLITVSLLLETRKGKKSVWWPWIATFPSAQRAIDSLGYFASNDEFACLPPRGQLTLSAWRQQAERFTALAKDICDSKASPVVKVDDKKAPLTPPQLVQKFMCQVERPQVDWAVSMITSRSFNFVRYTTMFPVLDILPYRINATLRPGKIHTEDDGQMVSIELQTSGTVHAGDVLSFRTDLQDPIHALLSQGFHDENNFGEGYEVFLNWDPLVLNTTSGKREGPRNDGAASYPLSLLNCGSSHEANIVSVDGAFHEELLRCAELQVLVVKMKSAHDDEATVGEFLRSYAFEDADIRRQAIDYAKRAVSVTLGESLDECVEVLSAEKAAHGSFGAELARHLTKAQSILGAFSAKLDSLVKSP